MKIQWNYLTQCKQTKNNQQWRSDKREIIDFISINYKPRDIFEGKEVNCLVISGSKNNNNPINMFDFTLYILQI